MERSDHTADVQPGSADDAGEWLGCGKLPRESLELAAIARVDRSVHVDERISTHLVLCSECLHAVDHLCSENALLSELARASKPDATAAPSTAGDGDEGEIPGYRLGAEIHRGGQGVVFEAEQVATRRRCAVKMLLGGRFASLAQRMRFEREVEVVAGLRHPAIVTLYESGISRTGEPWFAMEFVVGERLDAYVKRVKPSARQMAEIVRRVAEAIAYAHRRGVIHRDIKPGNILIDEEGAPRILDFGLARATDGADPKDPRSGSTIAGEVVGTFAYAAPEQLSGDSSLVDSRCDLYALGGVFYEMLAGVRPFEGAGSLAVLIALKAQGAPRRPSVVADDTRAAIDADLDVITLRLLAPDPARRYATAMALAEDLARFLDGRPILAREDSRAYVVSKTLRRHWLASGVAILFGLTALGGGIALIFAYSNAQAERARAELERQRVERAFTRFRSALESANPEEGPATSTMNVRDFLQGLESRLRLEMKDEPIALAQILRTLGLIQLGFDEPDRSRSAIVTSHDLIAAEHGRGAVSDEELALAERALAQQHYADHDLARSERRYREALARTEMLGGPAEWTAIDTMRQLATVLRRQGRLDEASGFLAQASNRAAMLPSTTDGDIVRAGILNGRGVVALEQGDHQLAIEMFREALDVLAEFVPENDYRRGRTLSSLASAEFEIGRLSDAEIHAAEAVQILLNRKGASAEWTRSAEELLRRIRDSRPEPR